MDSGGSPTPGTDKSPSVQPACHASRKSERKGSTKPQSNAVPSLTKTLGRQGTSTITKNNNNTVNGKNVFLHKNISSSFSFFFNYFF